MLCEPGAYAGAAVRRNISSLIELLAWEEGENLLQQAKGSSLLWARNEFSPGKDRHQARGELEGVRK